MKLLLDTHVFLWAITDDARLTADHKLRFLTRENELFLSTASIWEMLIKCGIGKLQVEKPAAKYLLAEMSRNRVDLLPILTSHLSELEGLPPLHRDPFDRMLVAQAKAENMPILSVDPELKKYGVSVL